MNTAMISSPRLLSEREAASYLGIVRQRTLQDWRLQGLGPAYSKLGKRIAYSVHDLDAFVRASRIEPKAMGVAA